MKQHPQYGTRQAGWIGMTRCLVFAFLVSMLAAKVHSQDTVASGAVGTKSLLRLGFSSSVFLAVNENDAKAAMKVWAQAIITEHAVAVAAEPQVLSGGEAIGSALQTKSIDALTITAEEYSALDRELLSTNAVLGLSGGVPTEEYLLLVNRDSPVARIDDLRGRSLVFFQNPRASLAPAWIETLLLKSGLGQTRQFFRRVTQGTKLTQAVLPVFFRQSDACVVTRRGFQTMIELNPQVGSQLKALVSSPPMVPVVFLFRADYSDRVRDQILAEIKKVHSTVASQQVLTLFQCENLDVFPVSALDSALDLLATQAQLSAAARQAEPVRADPRLPNGIAGRP